MSDETREPPGPAEPAEPAAPTPAGPDASPVMAPDAGPAVAPDAAPAAATPPPPPPPPARRSFLGERPEVAIEVPRRLLAMQSRRDFLLLAAGTAITVAGAWWLLPDGTKARLLGMAGRENLDTLAARGGLSGANRERGLNRGLH